ncbi:Basic immunoglobulin-like variable motif-containing protein [Frankliniella fusca]|uniref:Basic immunoglobulin-like variable motif-containing protein n=1 Tax=Frankliniella fusca TaxID=407009 RepID=A0AAE1HR96_9NEOP|nr:Basic immunoglobulin-like variable motif-containing protein [Frankliniella fusca]
MHINSRKEYLSHMPQHINDGQSSSKASSWFNIPRPPPVSPPSCDQSCVINSLTPETDPNSEQKIKDEFAKFYLRLESDFILPSSTVQVVAQQIQRTTELSHHVLKEKLKAELAHYDFESHEINSITSKLSTQSQYLREKYWKSQYPYVEPNEILLGVDNKGKKKCAHLFPLRDSLNILLRDPKVKAMVLQSFTIEPQDEQTFTPSKIFSDFTDGTAYAEHMKQHPKQKCLHLFLFQDGFDFVAFGPSQGVYKPLGFYYALGNIKSEYRTKLGCIRMLYLVLEKYFKTSLEEDLNAVDKIKEGLQPLLDELADLNCNKMDLDGMKIPVCLMFGLGDSAGQHFIGRFVQCFIATHCCRFSPMSLKDYKDDPTTSEPFRTPTDYDAAVLVAKEKWLIEKEKALKFAKSQEQRERAAGNTSSTLKKHAIFKNARKKPYFYPSPWGHDLFEGIVKSIIPAILKNLSVENNWFDLDLLNSRIKNFICDGNDKNDAPTPLKSFDSLGGNASENLTLLRVLCFIIEDRFEDKEDGMWCLYLQIKEIVEIVAAPKITLQQVLYLKMIIKEFLQGLADHLPNYLVLKTHLLLHYPDLIVKWGPLIGLFTLRFESKHVFFKNVAKACKNYINITYTLARKYACKFALDHSDGLLPPDILWNKKDSISACNIEWSPEQKTVIYLIPHLEQVSVLEKIEIFGIVYRTNEILQLAL